MKPAKTKNGWKTWALILSLLIQTKKVKPYVYFKGMFYYQIWCGFGVFFYYLNLFCAKNILKEY